MSKFYEKVANMSSTYIIMSSIVALAIGAGVNIATGINLLGGLAAVAFWIIAILWAKKKIER